MPPTSSTHLGLPRVETQTATATVSPTLWARQGPMQTPQYRHGQISQFTLRMAQDGICLCPLQIMNMQEHALQNWPQVCLMKHRQSPWARSLRLPIHARVSHSPLRTCQRSLTKHTISEVEILNTLTLPTPSLTATVTSQSTRFRKLITWLTVRQSTHTPTCRPLPSSTLSTSQVPPALTSKFGSTTLPWWVTTILELWFLIPTL